ncbi:dihydrofolate reductase family protein [Pseudonocardia endophytica]|nr:dihydrofolate reductase family protein [Pseudonocardia endophytica]
MVRRRVVGVRPHVLLSAAMSLDGRLDDASSSRLVLSDAADLDRVDGVRAASDAILVGAGTVRADDPRLLVRSAERRAARERAGHTSSPLRVVLTTSGDLDPSSALFTTAGADTLVYASPGSVAAVRDRLGVEVAAADGLGAVLEDLASRGVARLMVEGGGAVHTALLSAGLVDEIQVVVAPFLVGDEAAPRFVGPGAFPQGPGSPMTLVRARPMGDLVLLHYRIGDPDHRWLAAACDLAERCPPSETAFSVGAVVVAADGEVLATGFSRAGSPADHAEEVALAGLDPSDPRLATATIYSSLEPCGARASRPVTCARHILDAGIGRVVTAWREPSTFVEGRGAEILEEAGVTVVELPSLAPLARRPNTHLTQ